MVDEELQEYYKHSRKADLEYRKKMSEASKARLEEELKEMMQGSKSKQK